MVAAQAAFLILLVNSHCLSMAFELSGKWPTCMDSRILLYAASREIHNLAGGLSRAAGIAADATVICASRTTLAEAGSAWVPRG